MTSTQQNVIPPYLGRLSNRGRAVGPPKGFLLFVVTNGAVVAVRGGVVEFAIMFPNGPPLTIPNDEGPAVPCKETGVAANIETTCDKNGMSLVQISANRWYPEVRCESLPPSSKSHQNAVCSNQ